MRPLPFLALLLLGACAGANAVTPAPRPAPTSAVQARRIEERECRAANAARDPQVLAVDWSDGDKIDLSDAMAKHLAIVRYDCDGVTVLRECSAEGTYAYGGVSPTRAAMRIDELAQLDAMLPLASADMKKAVQRGDTIDIATIVIGQHATATRSVSRSALTGRCEGATHFVRTAAVGAFAVAGGPGGKTNAGAELLGVGPMAKSFTPLERTGGELSACYISEFGATSTTPVAKCKALVSVLLSSIREEPEPVPSVEAPETESPVRVADRERFETVPIKNACKIGFRAATKDGACVKPDASVSFACDFTELDECKTQCEKGDGKSCWNVAAHILDPRLNTVKGDPRPDAFPWLVKACTHGHAHACGNVGYALRSGIAVAKDAERGIKMMNDACAKGDALSCIVLARLENFGDGTKQDLHASRTHYERACTLGLPRGCAESARMAEEGHGGTRDVAAAIRLYERACSERDETSCKTAKKLAAREASLGVAGAKVVADDTRTEKGSAPWPSPCQWTLRYEEKTSTCIVPDAAKTFVCDVSLFDECKKQCEHGSTRSCWNAGVNRLGAWSREIKGAREEAQGFLERACNGGHAPACTQLGAQIVAKEHERGVALLEKGCTGKDAPGCDVLAGHYSIATAGFTRDRVRAAVFYEKACDLGLKGACMNGARTLESDTEGIYRDPVRALHMLDAACTLSTDKSWCRKAARLRADMP